MIILAFDLGFSGENAESSEISWYNMGVLVSFALVMFLLIYGAQIFNSVRSEKVGNIAELLATYVKGSTVMLAKIVAVCLQGITQILLWGLISLLLISVAFPDAQISPMAFIPKAFGLAETIWCMAFAISGYLFYAAWFAAVGAMSDRDNENREYLMIITALLMVSFYVSMSALYSSPNLAILFSYIPFTAPMAACSMTVLGLLPLWQSILSLFLLVAFAITSLWLCGKIYSATILLHGQKITLKRLRNLLKT